MGSCGKSNSDWSPGLLLRARGAQAPTLSAEECVDSFSGHRSAPALMLRRLNPVVVHLLKRSLHQAQRPHKEQGSSPYFP